MTAREIAAGMAYLHGDNILHGDLTAGNILLVSSPKDRRQFSAKVGCARLHLPACGRQVHLSCLLCSYTCVPPMLSACCTALQIADFGLSRVMVETSISTGTYGTVTHMPPELLTSVRAATPTPAVLCIACQPHTGWWLIMQLISRHMKAALQEGLTFTGPACCRAACPRPPTPTHLACCCGRCTPGSAPGPACCRCRCCLQPACTSMPGLSRGTVGIMLSYTEQRSSLASVVQIIFNITVQKKQLEFPADTPQKFKVGWHLQRPTACTTHAA
jgi:serine/threonine protein kinase